MRRLTAFRELAQRWRVIGADARAFATRRAAKPEHANSRDSLFIYKSETVTPPTRIAIRECYISFCGLIGCKRLTRH